MIANELAQYLAAQSANITYDDSGTTGNIFVGFMPDTPDEAVMVKSTGGPEADTKLGYDSPVFQIIVRGGTRDDRTSGYDLAREIYGILHGLTSTSLPGGTWLVLVRGLQSEPVDIGPDENSRQEWSQNFEAEARAITTNRE